MIENDKVISERYEVANKLNNFFVDAIANLDIEPYIPLRSNETLSENIEDIIKKYESHPSIIIIKENVTVKDKFSFQNTTSQEMKDEIHQLDSRKASLENDIPISILKTASDMNLKSS